MIFENGELHLDSLCFVLNLDLPLRTVFHNKCFIMNKTAIPFVGWVEVKFLLKSGDALKPELVVPMVIACNPRVPEEPIIGYNVIEENGQVWNEDISCCDHQGLE